MTLVPETLHKQNPTAEMKHLPNLCNDSSFAVQFQFQFQFSFEDKGNFAVYDKDYHRNVWTSRKDATDAICWISIDNPAYISHNYT